MGWDCRAGDGALWGEGNLTMDSRISQKILEVVALKLFELTEFASPNQSIYFNFVRCGGRL